MRIIAYSGNSIAVTSAVCNTLAANRNVLSKANCLYPLALGGSCHTRLQIAASQPDSNRQLAADYGILNIGHHRNLQVHVREEIAAEIRANRPDTLFIGLPYAFCDFGLEDTQGLFKILSEFTDDVNALLHISPEDTAHVAFEAWQISLGISEPKILQKSHQAVDVWRSVFGQEEISVDNPADAASAIELLVSWLRIPNLKPEKSISLPSSGTIKRLQQANQAIEGKRIISRSLRDAIHAKIVDDATPDIDALLDQFSNAIEADRKKQRVQSRIQQKISDLIPQENDALSDGAKSFLDSKGKELVSSVRQGAFRPRNSGVVNFAEAVVPAGLATNVDIEPTGTLVIACLKNEAPYILEWIAHHRSIGVDNFLIYSNDCSDGSTEILDRLDKLGVIHHENNDEWKGKSPQQAALNKAIKHKAFRKAKWVAHIDFDEFINLRWGETGTLSELYAMTGDATNIAMTWRLFGSNNIHDFKDIPITKQFTGVAPAYCPKPHTVWGFKTLLQNIGAYAKLSCHRPNKLEEDRFDDVKWLNGSLMTMPENVKTQGWRSSVANIGYNAVQLNHYALRSADSFLVKRQRGRALHVDRSIGLNYWVRMDWNHHKDMTIQRFWPRTEARIAELMSDPELAKWHNSGVEWHKAKAAELKNKREFGDLYAQVTQISLTDDERTAASLAADMET